MIKMTKLAWSSGMKYLLIIIVVVAAVTPSAAFFDALEYQSEQTMTSYLEDPSPRLATVKKPEPVTTVEVTLAEPLNLKPKFPPKKPKKPKKPPPPPRAPRAPPKKPPPSPGGRSQVPPPPAVPSSPPSPRPPPEPSSPPPPPPISQRPPAPAPEPWDTHYMNLYTPSDPAGGLVLSNDKLHVDMKITSHNQIFGHFLSKYRFIYGYFSIYMKLIPGDSAGTIMTYYFSSPERSNKTEDTHDECDFEFLGNTTGEPITLQTNVYLNGIGNREVRHYLKFDPAEAFHKYSLLWNEHLIIWYVDDEVIRVHHNRPDVPFPTLRPMAVQCSLWNASDWATQGGKVKLNLTSAPFILQYEGFNGVDGCRACDSYPMTDPSFACTNPEISQCSAGHWWNDQEQLTTAEAAQLQEHNEKYVIYHYCKDYQRFPNGYPPECPHNFG